MKAYSEDLRTKIVEALQRGMNKKARPLAPSGSLSSVKLYTPKTANQPSIVCPKKESWQAP
jgi:hypothetical protein